MVTNYEETIKMPINEPAPGKRISQIQVLKKHIQNSGNLPIHWNTFALGKTDRQKVKQTDRQSGRYTDEEIRRWTAKQKDREVVR